MGQCHMTDTHVSIQRFVAYLLRCAARKNTLTSSGAMNDRMRWCRLHPKNLNEDVNRRISSCPAPTPTSTRSGPSSPGSTNRSIGTYSVAGFYAANRRRALSVNVHVLRFIRLSFTTETGASFLCSDFGTSEKSCSLSPEGKSGSRSKRRK